MRAEENFRSAPVVIDPVPLKVMSLSAVKLTVRKPSNRVFPLPNEISVAFKLREPAFARVEFGAVSPVLRRLIAVVPLW